MAWADAIITQQGRQLLQQSLDGIGIHFDFAAGELELTSNFHTLYSLYSADGGICCVFLDFYI